MPTDKYTNVGYIHLTTALNTLSFEELGTFISVFEKKAFLISRLEYFIGSTAIKELDAETDELSYGMSTANTFAAASLAEPAIFDFNGDIAVLQGAGVSSHIIHQPQIKDLSTLPSGGVLVPSRPIFLWANSAGLAAAMLVDVRVYFTVVDLKAEEYWELVEAMRIIGV